MIVVFLLIWRRWNFQLLTIAYLLTTGFSANATTCNLMNKLTKRPLLMEVTQPYSADNPMAGVLYKMVFSADGKYDYHILNNGKQYHGKYRYRLVEPNIGVIDAQEEFEGQATHYTITLLCENEHSGVYFYQQSKGIGGQRVNIGRYYIDK